MLSLKRGIQIFACIDPVDFRKGIDSLASMCRYELDWEPNNGSLFLFCNRRRNAVKILIYDNDGYWLIMKRFSKGKLVYWPTTSIIERRELQILLNRG